VVYLWVDQALRQSS